MQQRLRQRNLTKKRTNTQYKRKKEVRNIKKNNVRSVTYILLIFQISLNLRKKSGDHTHSVRSNITFVQTRNPFEVNLSKNSDRSLQNFRVSPEGGIVPNFRLGTFLRPPKIYEVSGPGRMVCHLLKTKSRTDGRKTQ